MPIIPFIPPFGNTANNMARTGKPGEITSDTQLKTVRVHDGVTPGGQPLSVVGHGHAAAAISGLAAVATSGSYDDLSNKPAAYTLPVATNVVLGGVKQGTGITIAGDGTISVNGGGAVTSVAGRTGNVTLTTADIGGLATVAISNSYNDLTNKPTPVSLGAVPLSTVGQANGVAGLDSGGRVPSAQLPSYTDDVLEYADLASFPGTGETGKIYVALDSNKTYRWSGSVYIELVSSPGTTDAVPEGTVNKYFTNVRAAAAAPVQSVAGKTGVVTLVAADISGFATVATSGSYNDLTNKPVAYSLPTASASVLGGVKVGTGLAIDGDGILSVTATGFVTSVAGRTGAVVLTHTDIGGLATVASTGEFSDLNNVPAPYTLPVASTTVLGGVKQGTGISIAGDGTISSTGGYTLPVATTTVLGGVKQGTNVTIAGDGTISSSLAAGSLTGTTLAANVVSSSLTSVGTLAALTVTAAIVGSITGNAATATTATSATSATTATNLAGGVAGGVAYQTGAGATSVTAAGTVGQVLTSNGASAPTWTTPVNAPVTTVAGRTGDVVLSYTDISGLATVASSGSYADLSNKPTITSLGGVATSAVGANNGVASLDSGGKVPTSQLPESVVGGMNYQGTWNASTNSPTLANGTGTKGHYYKVNVAGNTTIDGQSNWTVGDLIAFDGTVWEQIQGGASDVLSVAGRVGAITLVQADIGGLTTASSPTFAAVTAATFTGALVGNATTATTATNVAGGVAGGIPYQTGAGATAVTAAGTSGQVLTSNGAGAPTWSSPGASAAGSLTGTTLAANVVASSLTSVGTLTSLSVSGQISSTLATGTAPFSVASTTPVANLSIGGNAATATSATTAGSATTATTAGKATNLVGAQWSLPYQSATDTTLMLAAGTAGQVLTSNGNAAPSWAAASVAASALTGTTLAAGVVTSSLTSVGTLASLAVTGNITMGGLDVGTKIIPQNAQSADYGIVLTDSGKHLYHPTADTTGRTWTIPANSAVAYPIGTAITFAVGNGAGSITIAITSDTLRWVGTGATGSRILSANGQATALKVTATEWQISGVNLT